MSEEKSVILEQGDGVGIVFAPEIVLKNAARAAASLASVISGKKKPVIFRGEQYLEFEDWQTVGQFYGYAVKTRDAILVEIGGVKGAKAQADLIHLKTGEIVGGAEAYCMRDEENWNTRPKFEWQGQGDNRKQVKVGDEPVPWFQLASMAQTRAGAKALRNRLAWVVVLAGYRPTPAEEITGAENGISQTPEAREQEKHYCHIHHITFFKSSKMKSYAHPIEGTKEWCHEPTTKVVIAEVGEKGHTQPSEETDISLDATNQTPPSEAKPTETKDKPVPSHPWMHECPEHKVPWMIKQGIQMHL